MKKLALFIGAPGSGKTTNAELQASSNEQISHYSTGDLLRAEVASGSELGKLLDSYMSKGLIVPIEHAIKTITNALLLAPTPYIIIDGYPRSLEQLDALEQFLSSSTDVKLCGVVEIFVSDEVAKERVVGRNRGADDNLAVFENRLNLYKEPLEAIKSHYAKQDLLYRVDANGELEQIQKDTSSLLAKLFS